jgi:hypothetical protein
MIYVAMYSISHDAQEYDSRVVQRAFVQTPKNIQLNQSSPLFSIGAALNVVIHNYYPPSAVALDGQSIRHHRQAASCINIRNLIKFGM